MVTCRPEILVFCAVALFAVIAATPATAAMRSNDAAAAFPRPSLTALDGAAPIVVAQGRCFNGRCY